MLENQKKVIFIQSSASLHCFIFPVSVIGRVSVRIRIVFESGIWIRIQIRIRVESRLRIRIKVKIQELSTRFKMEPWKTVGTPEAWRLKMEAWRVCRPMVAESHHHGEEQDADPEPH
jgi:hypothetical protein